MAGSYNRDFPNGTLRITTGCQYCAVGCGYQAFLVPRDAEPGEPVNLKGVSHFITSAMRGTVQYKGRAYDAAVAPDPRCDLNKGNHSIRGGSQGGNLVTHDGSGRSTRDRLRSPRVRLADGSWAEISWETADRVLSRLIARAADLRPVASEHTPKIEVGNPAGLGVKIYEYQYLENTFAATKLFFSALGTPNVAYHDRPSVADSSPGMNDAGFRAHDFAYEDLRAADVVFILGTNPYENQSVFFMQHCAGKQLIVLDPRYTPTAQYAVETGGLFLQPQRPGADSLVLYTIAREILERFEAVRGPGATFPLRLPVGDPATLRSAEKPDERRRASRVMDFAAFRAFLGVGDRERTTYTLDHAAEVSGIGRDALAAAVSRLFRPEASTEDQPRVAILYEKGLIWGFNYHNTAAVASLGLLLGSYGTPGRLTGRVGGHQKGWAEARVAVEAFAGSSGEGYPFRNGTDTYADADLAAVFPRDPVIKTRHNLDNHLLGPPPDSLDRSDLPGGFVRLRNGLRTRAVPDIRLLWIIGGNYLGQTNDAARKREVLKKRLGGDRPLRPESAGTEAILDALITRMDAGGLVLVHQEIFANPTTDLCDLVLPAAGWGEETFCRFNAQRRLKLYERFQDPPLHSADSLDGERFEDWDSLKHSPKPDWVIFRDVARALGRLMDERAGGAGRLAQAVERAFPWASSAEVADAMARESDLGLAGADAKGASMLGDLLDFAASRGIPARKGRVHTLLGKGGEGWARDLAEHYSIPQESTVHGSGVSTNGVLLPVRVKRDSTGAAVRLEGTLRVPRSGPFFFVRARWEEIEREFWRIHRPTGQLGEVVVLNGRMNHLWNNMFHHLRNEFINEICPEDLPGTLLEVHPAWAAGLGLRNGQVVAVEAQGHSFRGVISLQESLRAGAAFALFSYPVREERELGFSGYVNNVVDGYTDGINPIAALKYGRAVVRKVPHPSGGENWIFPDDFEAVKRAGPSFAPRNRVRPGEVKPVDGAPKLPGERSDWEMRELLVTRGLPRALLGPHRGHVSRFLDPDAFLEHLQDDPDLREKIAGLLPSAMKWRIGGRIVDEWFGGDLDRALEWLKTIDVL